jgi:hypothetical protein
MIQGKSELSGGYGSFIYSLKEERNVLSRMRNSTIMAVFWVNRSGLSCLTFCSWLPLCSLLTGHS